ncbi:hypothetical protein V6Z11_D10G173400 [Gossypium hirsutum]
MKAWASAVNEDGIAECKTDFEAKIFPDEFLAITPEPDFFCCKSKAPSKLILMFVSLERLHKSSPPDLLISTRQNCP